MKKWRFAVLLCTLLAFIISCGDDNPKPTDTDDLSTIPMPPPQYITPPQPEGFPKMEQPSDNLLTTEGVELGRRLFYDPILSRDSSMSCSSCHLQQFAFSDAKAVSTGIDNIAGTRSAMSLINLGFQTRNFFWDGRSPTLEAQALLPVEDPIELHTTWENVETKLRQHADYPTRFRKAFGISNKKEISKTLVAKALAQFQRTLVSNNSKFDKVIRREDFFDDDELVGYQLFTNSAGAPDAQCSHCHAPPFVGNMPFFNNGLDTVASLSLFRDKGRGGFTGNIIENGKFRTPTLRNIMLTAPYMHDGRFQTIEAVIEHYASGGKGSENVDPFIPQIRDINLTARQKRQIIAFLKTLTDTSFINNPNFKNPF